MPDFTVHTIPGSPYARAVFTVLEVKGARYALAPVAPGSLKSDAHLALHPFGRIPILVQGDFRLYETQAILRYLDRILPTPALTPADPKAAARMDQLMNVCDWYLFQGGGATIGFQRVVSPRLMRRAPDEAAIAAALPKARNVLAELGRDLADQPFLVGEKPTLADFMIAPHLDFLVDTPEWGPLTENAPNLTPYMQRMRALPSMAATTWDAVAAMAA